MSVSVMWAVVKIIIIEVVGTKNKCYFHLLSIYLFSKSFPFTLVECWHSPLKHQHALKQDFHYSFNAYWIKSPSSMDKVLHNPTFLCHFISFCCSTNSLCNSHRNYSTGSFTKIIGSLCFQAFTPDVSFASNGLLYIVYLMNSLSLF